MQPTGSLASHPYLTGAYAPIADEGPLTIVETTGELPRDLRGTYLRNGPSPRYQPRDAYHWFDGDGLMHAATFEDGRVTGMRRWVRTRGMVEEAAADAALYGGIMSPRTTNPREDYKNTANTDVIGFRGEALASWYIHGSAHRLDPKNLETLGEGTFGEAAPVRMSAHAKVDPDSGELFFFDYGVEPAYLSLGCVGADGHLKYVRRFDVPHACLPHDCAITKDYGIVMDVPMHVRADAHARGRWATDFERDVPLRFGVVPKAGGDVRWFEASSCYVYHLVNSWQDGDSIVIVGCRVADPIPSVDPSQGFLARALANLRVVATLHEWRLDLRTGALTERTLCDRNTEFPCIDLALQGRPSRFSYHMDLLSDATLLFTGLSKYDARDWSYTHLPFGPHHVGSEAAFAPRPGRSAEDDGWLATFVTDLRELTSELWVIDARDVAAGPVFKARFAERIPLGFHATFMA